MKNGYALIAQATSRVRAGLQQIKRTLIDACLAAKRKVLASLSALRQLAKRSVKLQRKQVVKNTKKAEVNFRRGGLADVNAL